MLSSMWKSIGLSYSILRHFGRFVVRNNSSFKQPTRALSSFPNEPAISGHEPVQIPVAPSSHTSPSFMHDTLAGKFINMMMWDGKKTLSQRIFREALEIIKEQQYNKYKTSSEKSSIVLDPLEVFHRALENVMPLMGTTGIRKGGKLYQVPVLLHSNRRRFLSMKWLITAARERPGSRRIKMPQRLALEILDAFNNQGTAVKKKQDLHRLSEANRAFVHFRW